MTDESFEYKSRIDATGKRFLKTVGQIYARRRQQTEYDPEALKSFVSIGVDERMDVASTASVLQNWFSKARKNAVASDERLLENNLVASMKTLPVRQRRANIAEMASTSTKLFQPTQENQNSFLASGSEVNLHRARFDSLFRAETIANDVPSANQALTEQPAEAGPMPKLLLKRKAAWSGIVRHQSLDAANVVRGIAQDVHEVEVAAPLQNSEVKDSETSLRLLQYQHQRYVFVTTAAKLCTEPRNSRGIANDVSQLSSRDNKALELTEQVRRYLDTN